MNDQKKREKHEREEGSALSLDFDKLARVFESRLQVVPVAVQHAKNGKFLMLAFVSEEALSESIRLHRAVFYSTSRGTIWYKGDTSGDFLHLEKVYVNCEQNSLLFLVTPEKEGVCHTVGEDGKHRDTCYYRELADSNRLIFDRDSEKKT